MEKNISQILVELADCLDQQILEITEFPRLDIIALVFKELNSRIEELRSLTEHYIYWQNLTITDMVQANDAEGLVDALKLLARDMEDEYIGTEQMRRIQDVIQDQFCSNYVLREYQKHACATKTPNNIFVGRGVIYTVITGNYDVLSDPQFINKDLDYICFTDNDEMESGVWKIKKIMNDDNLDSVRLARKYKILCYEYLREYDYSIYVDGKIQIIGDMEEYISKYSKGSPMICFPHYSRNCTYNEAETCINCNKDNPEIINKQIARYKREGYPEENGMIDSACVVRLHHDIKLQKVLWDWWEEVRCESRRDQLSLGYACWKNNFQYDVSDLFLYKNRYIYVKEHN